MTNAQNTDGKEINGHQVHYMSNREWLRTSDST